MVSPLSVRLVVSVVCWCGKERLRHVSSRTVPSDCVNRLGLFCPQIDSPYVRRYDLRQPHNILDDQEEALHSFVLLNLKVFTLILRVKGRGNSAFIRGETPVFGLQPCKEHALWVRINSVHTFEIDLSNSNFRQLL